MCNRKREAMIESTRTEMEVKGRDENLNEGRPSLLAAPVLWGSLAGLLLLFLYFAIVTIANSFAHALEEFRLLWYWIAALVLGFGLQAGLFSYVRRASRIRRTGTAGSAMAVSGGVSTTSMIACCAHHVTDIAPFLGVAAATVFLTRFQEAFLALGVASNAIGIVIMLRIIKKHGLHPERGALSGVVKVNMNRLLVAVSLFGLVIIGAAVYGSL
jgi:hypothetical protein